MERIRWIGDRLVPGIKFTMDLPEFHQNRKCPLLDLQVWGSRKLKEAQSG